MTLLRLAARPMLASMFLYGGWNAVKNPQALAPRAKAVTDKIGPAIQRAVPGAPTDAATLIRINGAVQVAAGTLLATGRFPKLAGLVLAGSLVPTTFAGHPFWEEADPGMRANQTIHFLKNVSMMGGLLMSTLDPDPKKKMLPRRAKDKVVEATEAVSHQVAHLKP